MNDVVENLLEHHGIKGMHWGIRRKRTGFQTSEDFQRARELRKKKVPELSNQELKTLNERLNLEQNFRRLNPTRISKGRRHLKAFFKTAGLATPAAIMSSPIGQHAMTNGKNYVSKFIVSHLP